MFWISSTTSKPSRSTVSDALGLHCLEQRFVELSTSRAGDVCFKHDSELGNAPAHALFERIMPRLKTDITAPRAFSDHDIIVRDAALPAGVTLQQLA